MSKMIEVKAAELIGTALDWVVAQALGYSEGEDAYCNPAWFDGDRYVASKNQWRPSTDWGQGGILFDRYDILVGGLTGKPYAVVNNFPNGCGIRQNGPTKLIAACRAIVTYKLGDVVQVPAELLERAQ